MKISTTTITEPAGGARARRLPGWVWFCVLWAGGVASAVTLGYAFKLLMNLTLFASGR